MWLFLPTFLPPQHSTWFMDAPKLKYTNYVLRGVYHMSTLQLQQKFYVERFYANVGGG